MTAVSSPARRRLASGLICSAVAAVVGLAYPLVAAGGLLLMASHIWLGYRRSALLCKAPAP